MPPIFYTETTSETRTIMKSLAQTYKHRFYVYNLASHLLLDTIHKRVKMKGFENKEENTGRNENSHRLVEKQSSTKVREIATECLSALRTDKCVPTSAS